MHKVIRQELHDALREVVGDSRVLRRRPRDRLSLRRCGVYQTEAGKTRGPTPYMYVAALAAKWEEFPQTTRLASAVRLGYLTKEQAAIVMSNNMDAVSAGLLDLKQRQDAIKKFGVRLHEDQDFSGTPNALSGPKEGELALMKAHNKEVSRLKRKLAPEARVRLTACRVLAFK